MKHNELLGESGCLVHPGASVVASKLLDEYGSHGWKIPATQPSTTPQAPVNSD